MSLDLPDLANDLLRGIASAQRETTTRVLPPTYRCPDCGFRTHSDDCAEDCPRCGGGSMPNEEADAETPAPPPPAWVANFREASESDEPNDGYEHDRDCGDEVER